MSDDPGQDLEELLAKMHEFQVELELLQGRMADLEREVQELKAERDE